MRIVDLGSERPDAGTPPGILVGVDRRGRLPAGVDACDLLLTVADNAPRPWVSLSAAELDRSLARLRVAVARNPVASAALVQMLRAGRTLTFEDALVLESALYSTLLGGAEFRAWRRSKPLRRQRDSSGPRVVCAWVGTDARITLTRPDRRNAVDARMRDELVEALRATAANPATTGVLIEGQGPDFCAGGDLNEFGLATDLATAHFTRLLRSPARLVHLQRDLVTARIHGACIGAGIEVAAAAGRLIADRGAWFHLPEVGMGLIPGAGGTVTVPRRIGRRRTAWMALLGEPVDARTALDWGLVDALEVVR
jgi:enoyl-CoA hydratase/carnithine racemase